MAVSQNGYSANDRSIQQSYQIGDSVRVTLRKGSGGELLAHFARWFDKNIRDIDPGILDDWGYAERPIRGGTELSNHAAGLALDLNATKWALGSRASRYLTVNEIAAIHAQLRVYEGAIRWGEDYSGRTDPMHFEIIKGQAEIDRVWAKISGGAVPSAPAPKPGGPTYGAYAKGAKPGSRTVKQLSAGDDVKALQRWLGIAADGFFGPATETKVKETQSRNKLTADGIVGPKTWAVTGMVGAAPAPAPAPAPKPAPAPAPSGHRPLKKGDRGDDVKALQHALRTQYPAYRDLGQMVEDGVFGNTTDKWVRRFQDKSGLGVDGVVGPKTRAKLGL